ncbi:hypothetical protein HDU80_003129 [Chytriomyces hyalinus]|nr:hypothetical protein HDU80_003129 [Chytriomyces hyalinus]
MHSINIMTWTVLAIVPYLLTASADPLSKRQFDGDLFDGISGFNDVGASEGIIGGEEGLISSSGGREVIGGEEGILRGGRVISSGSRLSEGISLDDEFGDISSGFRGGLESDGFDSVGSFWWNGNRIFSNNFVNSVSNSFRIPRRTVQIIIIQMSRIRSSGNIFQSSRRIARSNNVPIVNIVRIGRLSWRYLRNRGFTRSNSSRNRNLIIVIRTMSSGSFVRRMRPTRVVVVIPSVSNRFSRWSRQSRISVNSWNSLIQDCFFQWSRGVWGSRSGNILLNGGSWSEGGFNGDSRFDSTWEESWGSAESWITGSGCCDSFLGSDSLFGKKRRRDAGSDKMQTAAADFIDAVSNNADTLCKADTAKTWMAKFSKSSGLDQTVMAGIAGEVVNMMMDDDITKDNMAMFDAFSCVAMSAVDMDQLPEAFGKSVSESQDAAMNLLMETPAEAVEADKADKKEQAAKVPMTKEEMDAMTPAEKEAAAKKPMTKEEMDAMTPAEKEAAAKKPMTKEEMDAMTPAEKEAKKPMTKEEMDAMPKEPSANSNKVAMSAEEMAKMPMKAMTAEEMAKMPKKAMTAEEMAKMPKKAMSAEEMAKMPKMSAEEMAKMPKMSAEEMSKMPMKAMTPEEMAKMPKKAMSAEEMSKMPKKAMSAEEMAKMPMKAMTPEEMAKMPASAQAQAQSPTLAAKSGAMMVASSAFAFISLLLF